jgi:hypothetical protein
MDYRLSAFEVVVSRKNSVNSIAANHPRSTPLFAVALQQDTVLADGNGNVVTAAGPGATPGQTISFPSVPRSRSDLYVYRFRTREFRAMSGDKRDRIE